VIGEKIYVFWYEDDLMYWYGLDRGFYKYLPEKWSFKKKRN
jgi:hypothetical protein